MRRPAVQIAGTRRLPLPQAQAGTSHLLCCSPVIHHGAMMSRSLIRREAGHVGKRAPLVHIYMTVPKGQSSSMPAQAALTHQEQVRAAQLQQLEQLLVALGHQ